MRWRKRRGTLDKTPGKTSAGTPSTSLAVKTIYKKKKIHKIRGKWLITPVDKVPGSSGDITATTLATNLSKKTLAKDSTTNPAKVPFNSRKIPSTTPAKFINKTFLKKSVFKVTSSSNLEVKENIACTAADTMTGLLIEGLGKLKRKQRIMEDIPGQKGFSQPQTNWEKDETEILPEMKRKISVGEMESEALKVLLKEIKLKKKEKNKFKKKQKLNQLKITPYKKSHKEDGPAKQEEAFTEFEKGAAIIVSDTNSEMKKEAKPAYEVSENGDAVKPNPEEIKLKKKEKKKERKKKQQQKRRAAKRKFGKQMKKTSLKKEAPAKKKERFINPDGSKSKRSLKEVEKVKKRRSG